MLKEERQLAILREVEIHNKVLLTDLTETLSVSSDTVRRDIKELDAAGKLKKVHGGAIALGFYRDMPDNDDIYALDAKKTIAQKACSLIEPGSTILIDGGTTCSVLARSLPYDLEITCFTLSISVAQELLQKPAIKSVFLGGELLNDSQMAVGAMAIHNLSEVSFDQSFVGTGYIDAHHGLSEFDWEIVQLKKAIIKASKKTILLSIAEKIGTKNRYKTCDLNQIETMITELSSDSTRLDGLQNSGVQLL